MDFSLQKTGGTDTPLIEKSHKQNLPAKWRLTYSVEKCYRQGPGFMKYNEGVMESSFFTETGWAMDVRQIIAPAASTLSAPDEESHNLLLAVLFFFLPKSC